VILRSTLLKIAQWSGFDLRAKGKLSKDNSGVVDRVGRQISEGKVYVLSRDQWWMDEVVQF
jgi:hypothetical protein